MLIKKRMFKIIVFILIQAFLLLDFAWAYGSNGGVALESSTLSAPLQINSQVVDRCFMFMQDLSFAENKAEEATQFKNPKIKEKSIWGKFRTSIAGFIANIAYPTAVFASSNEVVKLGFISGYFERGYLVAFVWGGAVFFVLRGGGIPVEMLLRKMGKNPKDIFKVCSGALSLGLIVGSIAYQSYTNEKLAQMGALTRSIFLAGRENVFKIIISVAGFWAAYMIFALVKAGLKMEIIRRKEKKKQKERAREIKRNRVIFAQLIDVLNKKKMYKDRMMEEGIPAAMKAIATTFSEENKQSAIAFVISVGIKIAEKDVGPCAFVEWAVPFAARKSQGDIAIFKQYLVKIAEKVVFLGRRDITIRETLEEINRFGIFELIKSPQDMPAAMSVAQHIINWHKASRGYLDHNSVRKIINFSRDITMLDSLFQEENRLFGTYKRVEYFDAKGSFLRQDAFVFEGETGEYSHTECSGSGMQVDIYNVYEATERELTIFSLTPISIIVNRDAIGQSI